MKNTLTLLCFLLISTFLSAQAPAYQYAGIFGNSYNVFEHGCAADANDNVYLCGQFDQSNFDLDPGAGTQLVNAGTSPDGYLIKLNSAGVFQWGFSIGGTGSVYIYDIDCTPAGTTIISGLYAGSNIDFDPGAGFYPLPVVNGIEGFAACYDNTGALLWAYSLTGTGDQNGWSVSIDAAGYAYIAWEFQNTVMPDPFSSVSFTSVNNSADMLIVKLTPTGTYVNAWMMGGTYAQQPLSLSVDNTGHVILTGNTTSTVDFDPSGAVYNLTTPLSQLDMFVASYDTNGTFNWAFLIATGTQIQGEHVECDNNGNMFIIGSLVDTADFNPGAGTNIMASDQYGDSYIVSYDSTGAYRFSFLIGAALNNDVINDLSVDASGDVYLGGAFYGVNDFDPGPGYDTIRTYNYGQTTAAFVAKYSNSGAHQWAFHFQPTVFNYEARVHAIDVNSNGNVFVTGYVGADCDFDPVGTTVIPNNNRLTFSAKYGGACVAPTAPTAINGTNVICAGTTNTYSVSPVANASTYNWTLPAGWIGSSTSNSITPTASTTSGTISVSASNICGTSPAVTMTVTVNPLPIVSYVQSPDTFCIPGPVQTLTPGSPAGGSYVGSYIVGNTIDPSTLPVDDWYIYYTYTDANGCTAYDSSFVHSDVCNGIAAEEIILIEVYPNPFGDKLNFTNPSGETVTVEIISSLGEIVERFTFAGTQYAHNTARVATGIYFVRMSSNAGTQIETLVK